MHQGLLSRLAGCLLVATSFCSGSGLPRRCLELRPGAGNPRNSEGSFVVLKDGRILFIYSRYNGDSGADHASAELAARYSDDQGETWTQEDEIVIQKEGLQNVMSVSLLRLNDGSIAFFYLRKNNDYDCRPVLRISTDEGKTWGEAIQCIPDQIGYYVLNNDRVIQMKNGRLVAPVCQHSKQGDTKMDYMGTLLCYLSDDNGKTWRRGKQEWKVFDQDNRRICVQEPGVVELKDGRLMMFIRSNAGCQMISFSSDGGETWTPSTTSSILSPLSPASIKRIPKTGDLFLVWNNHDGVPDYLKQAGRRVPLSTAISKDDGKTWELTKTLEGNLDGGHYCYIAIDFIGDDVILGYCAMQGLAHSRITKVPLSWLYAPEPKVNIEYEKSLGDNLKEGAFTKLGSDWGQWTAQEGHAEVLTYTRGKGIRLMGGRDMQAVLTLKEPRQLRAIPITVERFTARQPYAFSVEAKIGDEWVLVAAQGEATKVGTRHPILLAQPDEVATALRFRCTSPAGAIIGDLQTVNLNAFFKD